MNAEWVNLNRIDDAKGAKGRKGAKEITIGPGVERSTTAISSRCGMTLLGEQHCFAFAPFALFCALCVFSLV